jgi:hypothetical protein
VLITAVSIDSDFSDSVACRVAWECGEQCNRLANFYSRSHDAVIRVYDEMGSVIETHEQKGDFKEP